MNLNDIQTLYAYNRWANLRMFSVVEKLTRGAIQRDAPEQLSINS